MDEELQKQTEEEKEELRKQSEQAAQEGHWARQNGMKVSDNFYTSGGPNYDGADSMGLALAWYNGFKEMA